MQALAWYVRLTSHIWCRYANEAAHVRQCLGQNFAYNEMSFFLVRLLQRFRRFELARDAQPPASLPPANWKTLKGRPAIEQVWPSISITPYIKVSRCVELYVAYFK